MGETSVAQNEHTQSNKNNPRPKARTKIILRMSAITQLFSFPRESFCTSTVKVQQCPCSWFYYYYHRVNILKVLGFEKMHKNSTAHNKKTWNVNSQTASCFANT